MQGKQPKPAFRDFLESNAAMLNCYNKIKKEDWGKPGADNQCLVHKERIKEILRSNEIRMSNIV